MSEYKSGDLVKLKETLISPDGTKKNDEVFIVASSDGLEIDLVDPRSQENFETWVGDIRHLTNVEYTAYMKAEKKEV